MHIEDVIIWYNYFGLLFEDNLSNYPTRLFGYKTGELSEPAIMQIDNVGACFGYVYSGQLSVQDSFVNWSVQKEQWFHVPTGCNLKIYPLTTVVICQRLYYQGMHLMGGPIEKTGRLRYIDGCTDSLLCCPPLKGDPCLNLLHFPSHTKQTPHTHPSIRAGIIARGNGLCCTKGDTIELEEGMVFMIAANSVHHFQTHEHSMDVIAYHPDSDWGPTHEEHPMINRTWVNGHKILS